MPTEISVVDSPLRLPEIEGSKWLSHGLPPATGPRFPILTMEATVEERDRLAKIFCALRASNIAFILMLDRPAALLTSNELIAFLHFLRQWDQLTLHNLLQLQDSYLPPEAMSLFLTEARTEIRWMREWLMASHDSRISKYPGLPWRSFIRKIISENFEFAQNLLLLGPQTETDTKAWHDLVKSFLIAKKKTVCVFPKHWSKMQ